MSNNLELVQSIYQAFARGDVPAVLGALDPAIEWREADNFIYAGGNPYIGPQAVLSGVFMPLVADWAGFSVTPEQFIDGGDTIVVLGRYRGTNKTTGASLNAQFAHVLYVQGGKVVRFQQYTDTLQAKEAAGGSLSAGA